LAPARRAAEDGLIGGDIFHGALDLRQIFSARPMLGYADYRGPIAGLFLCGSGGHPGGGVTGAPGHNASRCQLGVLHSVGPDGIARELSALARRVERATPTIPAQLPLPHLVMPAHHDVRTSDVLTPRLYANLAAAADRAPIDFAELLLVPGIGARTVRALAMVAEVMHGAPYRFTDPARFSFAHGGKDRHPFPVPLRVYDQTIHVLKSAVRNAKLGREEELAALRAA
jgi:hypothetical protein